MTETTQKERDNIRRLWSAAPNHKPNSVIRRAINDAERLAKMEGVNMGVGYGVNVLAERWAREGRSEDAADDLEYVARNAWRPVSDPPAEEDSDEEGFVAIWDGKKIDFEFWHTVPKTGGPGTVWARVDDVVLLPVKGKT